MIDIERGLEKVVRIVFQYADDYLGVFRQTSDRQRGEVINRTSELFRSFSGKGLHKKRSKRWDPTVPRLKAYFYNNHL